MCVITYSLRNNQADSDQYYNRATAFADEVFIKGGELLNPVIHAYLRYLKKSQETEPTGTGYEEALLELLILGVLWNTYSGDAMGLPKGSQQVLSVLGEMRSRNSLLKPGIDFLKGILSTLFLSPDLYDNIQIAEPGLKAFGKLLQWLEATGEFSQEVKRLERWENHLRVLKDDEIRNTLASAIAFALWFETAAEESVGSYTPNVERYLSEVRPERYWHEDVIFCGRRRVEYHLNMVGAEMMNRVFRKAFLKTRRKVLLLPGCMRLQPDLQCRALASGDEAHCKGCTPGCQVNQLSQMGKAEGFQVIMVSHESSISVNRNAGLSLDSDTGVIGVACVLNLISGGWRLQEMGIPAQCVLLDYCGCKNHWHEEGIPTRLNTEKLRQILDT